MLVYVCTIYVLVFQDITEAHSGDICALFGVECASGDTFVSHDALQYTMVHVHVYDVTYVASQLIFIPPLPQFLLVCMTALTPIHYIWYI